MWLNTKVAVPQLLYYKKSKKLKSQFDCGILLLDWGQYEFFRPQLNIKKRSQQSTKKSQICVPKNSAKIISSSCSISTNSPNPCYEKAGFFFTCLQSLDSTKNTYKTSQWCIFLSGLLSVLVSFTSFTPLVNRLKVGNLNLVQFVLNLPNQISRN